MSEIKQIEGRLTGHETGKSGTGKKGDWTLYKYKIDENYFTGFNDYSSLMNKHVVVAYKENPNPQNANNPFKNVINITEANSPSDLKESEQKYNVNPVDVKHEEVRDDQESPGFFGMVSNQTITRLEHLEKMGKEKLDSNNFDVIWNELFDRLWKLNKEKRKERLGY